MTLPEDFMATHRQRLLRMIERRMTPAVRGRFDAEDVVQEAMAEAMARGMTPDAEGVAASSEVPTTAIPFGWLYRITLQKYIDKVRAAFAGVRDVQRDVSLPDESAIGIGRELVASGPGPASKLQQKEMASHVREAMSVLPDRDRELIWMRIVDQLTFAETGDVLGLKENAAAVAFARALRKLRDACRRLSNDFESSPS